MDLRDSMSDSNSKSSSGGCSCAQTRSLSTGEDEDMVHVNDERVSRARSSSTVVATSDQAVDSPSPPSCLHQMDESLEPISIAVNGGGESPHNLRALHVVTDHEHHHQSLSLQIDAEEGFPHGHRSVVAETIYFDEISGIQDDFEFHQLQLQQKKESRKKLFVFAMVFLAFVAFGMAGLAVAVLRQNDGAPGEPGGGSGSPPGSNATARHPATPAPTATPAPSASRAPSAAPSCAGGFEFASSLGIEGSAFSGFEVSPRGTAVVTTHLETELFFARPRESLFFDTFDLSSGKIVRDTPLQLDRIDVQDIQMSADGSRMIVAAFGYGSDEFDLGGALLVFQRTSTGAWIRLYEQLTGGGLRGSVFTTATDAAGITFAIVAGVIGSDAPSYARVYRVQIGSRTLKNKGQDFVSGSITQNSLVQLSADGNRVFLYTSEDQVLVYDYDLATDRWREVGEPIIWPDSAPVSQMEASDDGRTLLLIPEVVNPTSYVFQQLEDDRWIATPLDWTAIESTTANPARLYYQVGSLAGDGKTISISLSYYRQQNSIVATNEVYVYQDRHNGWTFVHFVKLDDGNDFLGTSIDQTGSKLVAATQSSIQTYDLTCDESLNAPSKSPTPTVAPEPVASPTCADTFALAFSSALREDNVFDQESGDRVYSLSRDLSTIVVGGFDPEVPHSFFQTYAITKGKITTSINYTDSTLQSFAISGDGQVLVGGFRRLSGQIAGPSLIPFEGGGTLTVFRLDENVWKEMDTIDTGGGISGGVFHVALSYDGLTTAFVAGEDAPNGTFFVAAYAVGSNSTLKQIGNTLTGDWFDANATVGLVNERLFISTSDGSLRAYDLDGNSSTWQQVGDRMRHFDSSMFLSATDDSLVVTASQVVDINVFQYDGTSWVALDVTALNGYVASDNLVGVSVGRAEILVTESILPAMGNASSAGPRYMAKRFIPGGNSAYYLSSETELFHDGDMQATQLMDNGNMGFVLDNEVAVYTRGACESS